MLKRAVCHDHPLILRHNSYGVWLMMKSESKLPFQTLPHAAAHAWGHIDSRMLPVRFRPFKPGMTMGSVLVHPILLLHRNTWRGAASTPATDSFTVTVLTRLGLPRNWQRRTAGPIENSIHYAGLGREIMNAHCQMEIPATGNTVFTVW